MLCSNVSNSCFIEETLEDPGELLLWHKGDVSANDNEPLLEKSRAEIYIEGPIISVL